MAEGRGVVGTIEWTEHTGGVLTLAEGLRLVRPTVGAYGGLVAGRIALGLHATRRSALEPHDLAPPDSALAREATEAARDLLSPAVLNHSFRSFAWGAALAAIDGVAFDRELFHVASMFHDTGLPTPEPDVDFTVRSAAHAREFLRPRGVSPADQHVIADAIALHHTPGVGLDLGAEAFLLSAGAAVDVFGLRSHHVPADVRASVIAQYPRLGFKREFAGLFRTEARRVRHGRAWYLHRFAASDLTIRLAPFRG